MSFDLRFAPAICLSAAVLCAVTGAFALVRDVRSPAYRAFALGMAAFMVETILSYFSLHAVLPEQALLWSRWRMAASALVPGSWLLFSLSYSRSNFDEFSRRWKWVIVAAFALPAGLASLGWNRLLGADAIPAGNSAWVIPVGWSGYGLYIILLISSVPVLANLEKTLRTAPGPIRVQIELSILGTAALFAAEIYTSVEVLLFSALRTDLFTFEAAVLAGVNALFIASALRNRLREVRLYVSQDVLHGSLTVLVISLYLLAVALFARLAVHFGIGRALLANGLIGIAATAGIVLLLLSVKVRYGIRRFIQVNLRRPSYDYRKIWTDFTRNTSSVIDLERVCAAIANTVSEIFIASTVTVWLANEGFRSPAMAASTGPRPEDDDRLHQCATSLLEFVRARPGPVDLTRTDFVLPAEISLQYFEKAKIRYCVPLRTTSGFIGMMTMGNRTGPPLAAEDFDMLQTFADQAAGLIMNRKILENLGQAREQEAFQAVSAFFAHDLKNVASSLSFTLDNLPAHYDDPEFRADTFKIMSNNLKKIRTMCSRLSPLDRKFELQLSECDLNEVVSGTLSGLNLGCPLAADLGPVPKALLDPEQIRKILLNLLLNARESTPHGAEIRIATSREGDWMRLSVTDQGIGMSREFIRKNLFRPFKTTKKRGSGIGLFQCKKIIEAHGGRIEVQSREGRGSTFSVLLPSAGPLKS